MTTTYIEHNMITNNANITIKVQPIKTTPVSKAEWEDQAVINICSRTIETRLGCGYRMQLPLLLIIAVVPVGC